MTVAEVLIKYRTSENKLYTIGFQRMAAELSPYMKLTGMTLYRWARGVRPRDEHLSNLRRLAELPEGGKWSAWANDMLCALSVPVVPGGEGG
jgi:hypothetical protein